MCLGFVRTTTMKFPQATAAFRCLLPRRSSLTRMNFEVPLIKTLNYK
jgi:hypothetical protein